MKTPYQKLLVFTVLVAVVMVTQTAVNGQTGGGGQSSGPAGMPYGTLSPHPLTLYYLGGNPVVQYNYQISTTATHPNSASGAYAQAWATQAFQLAAILYWAYFDSMSEVVDVEWNVLHEDIWSEGAGHPKTHFIGWEVNVSVQEFMA